MKFKKLIPFLLIFCFMVSGCASLKRTAYRTGYHISNFVDTADAWLKEHLW